MDVVAAEGLAEVRCTCICCLDFVRELPEVVNFKWLFPRLYSLDFQLGFRDQTVGIGVSRTIVSISADNGEGGRARRGNGREVYKGIRSSHRDNFTTLAAAETVHQKSRLLHTQALSLGGYV